MCVCVCVRVGLRCWSLARGKRLTVSTAVCLIRSLSLLLWSSPESCVVIALVSFHSYTYRKLSDQTKWIIISSNRDKIIINTLCMFYCNLLQCRNCCPRNIPPATCILIEPDLYSLLGPLLLNHTWELLAELSWALMWFSLCIALMTNACVALFVSL